MSRQHQRRVAQAIKKSAKLLCEQIDKEILEKVMEKYGVEIEKPDKEKTAAQGCPLCGSPLEKDSSIPKCPVHGTAPFEKGREK